MDRALGIMFQIPQHGKDHSINDLNDIIPFVEKHFHIDLWMIEVEECLGEGAIEVETKTRSGLSVTTDQLKVMYSGIFQTIDGVFTGFSDSEEVVNLIAIDSTC